MAGRPEQARASSDAGVASSISSEARDCCESTVNVNCFLHAKICLADPGNGAKVTHFVNLPLTYSASVSPVRKGQAAVFGIINE